MVPESSYPFSNVRRLGVIKTVIIPLLSVQPVPMTSLLPTILFHEPLGFVSVKTDNNELLLFISDSSNVKRTVVTPR